MPKVTEYPAATALSSTDKIYGVVGGVSSSLTPEALGQELTGVIDVKRDYDAVGDGVADDTTAVQAAIDQAETNAASDPTTGPAIVFYPAGKYLLGQITLRPRVWLVGAGPQATCFKAKDNLNDHLFLSEDFATLTGTTNWLVSQGVPTYLGFFNCRIDGNKANQTAGDGIRMFSKAIFMENVIVHSCFGNGVYTEAGETAGQAGWPDYPEGRIGFLQTASNGGHGWHMRGPHDIYCDRVTSWLNTGDGMRLESSSGSYLATADFNILQCYSNGGRALYGVDSSFRASLMRLENSDQEGLYLQNCDHCQFGTVHLFDNGRVSGSYQGVIDASSNYNGLSVAIVRRAGRTAAGGLQVAGGNNKVGAVIRGDVTGGGNSTGVGLDVPGGAQHNNIDAVVDRKSVV